MAPLHRRWLALVGALALALTFAQSPGQISPDTKLDLTANPLRFLLRASNLWNSELPFGQAQNQAYGYLFPHGTFFLIGHALGIPVHGVCSLDAIGVRTTGDTLVVTDARRREVYWARYRDGMRSGGPAVPVSVELLQV